MSSFSDTLETAILNSTLRGVDFTKPGVVYVALFTADPTDANVTANEVQTTGGGTWTNYVRVNSVAASEGLSGAWTAPSVGADGAMVSSNANVITFPANNGVENVVVTHMGLYDNATAGQGNLLYHAPLVASKTLLTNDVLAFGTGSITVSLK